MFVKIRHVQYDERKVFEGLMVDMMIGWEGMCLSEFVVEESMNGERYPVE